MFDFLTTNPALALLKKDHDTVKDLFDKFEKAEGRPAKKKIVNQALEELKVHAAIEEELFYPAVRKPDTRSLWRRWAYYSLASSGNFVSRRWPTSM